MDSINYPGTEVKKGERNMQMSWKGRILWVVFLALALTTTGCARLKELERINRQQAATIVSLNEEVNRLSDELDKLAHSQNDLARTKAELEKRLKNELASGDLNVQMSDRGIVVSVLDRVLFDAGKAELKSTAQETLQKVADVLGQQTADNRIFIEGHTDSDPIRHSGWRSNWELSTTRATEVIHYFTDNAGLEPNRFVASGYGEFKPVADNASTAGKSQNRRVEIIISPSKVGDATSAAASQAIDTPMPEAAAESAFIK